MSPSAGPKPPGIFSWHELATRDAAGAKAFYSALFGWGVEDSDVGEMGTYTKWTLPAGEMGAMYQMSGPMFEGVPSHWLNYVTVASVDDTAQQAGAIGGKVLLPPMDVMDFGRMAVVTDPTGASLGLWQAKSHHGKAEVGAMPGAPCWCELITDDTDAAAEFYGRLFDWTTKPGGDYIEFLAGGESRGGMMAKKPEMGPIPSCWSMYVAVADCDAVAAKATELGAQTYVPPQDIPGVGRFACFADPAGAGFSIIHLTEECLGG